MPTDLSTLAQAAVRTGTPDPLRLIYIIGVLILVVLALGLIALQLRKRLLADDADSGSAGSVLEQMRGMLKRGDITQAEFDTMRRRMVDRMSTKALSTADVAPPNPMNPHPHASKTPTSGDRIAPPGFDLTGRPLPRPNNPTPRSRSGDIPPGPHQSDNR